MSRFGMRNTQYCLSKVQASFQMVDPYQSHTHILLIHISHYLELSRGDNEYKAGTGITLVPERNPLLLAKEIATLDRFREDGFCLG
ncbi:MAG: hypothetical protein CM1200mP15_10560 [Dehalococcoidia bacterium]|nr:MAG: hypothetical protein CM1200mP15_10560 [Dehalococcoidia bacterium]